VTQKSQVILEECAFSNWQILKVVHAVIKSAYCNKNTKIKVYKYCTSTRLLKLKNNIELSPYWNSILPRKPNQVINTF